MGAVSTGLLVTMASVFIIAAQAQVQPVDVCPANSLHKTLPFLKAAKPGALSEIIGNGLNNINMAAVTPFIQKTLVPMIGANVFFFALAALFLLIFILWRFLRFCCYMICCKSSCDAKRDKRNPHKLLFNTGTKFLKCFMCLFGLIAIIFAIYGMATVKKNMTDDAFGVVTTLSDYAVGVTDVVDRLLGTIGGVNTIINDLQAIVINDIDVTGLSANLTAIGTFLDTIPTPTSLLAKISTLQNSFNTGFKGAGGKLALMQAGITTFSADLTALNSQLDVLTAAPVKYTTMKNKFDSVQTAMAAITWTSTTPPALAAMQAVQSAVNAIIPADQATWATDFDNINTAIQYVLDHQTATTNPFSKLKTLVTGVLVAVTDIQAQIASISTDINTLNTQHAAVQPYISGLMVKLESINATVIALTASMQAAYTNLAIVNSDMTTLLASPTGPSSFATSLNSFSTGMTSTAPLTALNTLLTTAESALNDVYFTNQGPGYKTWVTSTKNLFDPATLGSTAPSGALGNFKTAVDAFVSSQTQANWDVLNTVNGAAYTAFKPVMDPLAGAFASTIVSSTAAGFNTRATALKTAGTAASGATGAAGTYATAAGGQTLPSLAGLVTDVTSLSTSLATLGSPYSKVVNDPKAELASIESSAITTGDLVKTQINTTIASVRDSIGSVKNMFVKNLGDTTAQYEPMAKTVDGYRYKVSMAIYAVSILFVGLLLLAALLNYHFGANFSTLWLLIITVLYFLLALLIALLVSVLFLGCGELEPLMVQLAPATFTPLLRYYFYNEGTSVKAVLQAANVVDVDAMMAQVMSSQNNVLQGLTGTFTFRAAPLAVINRINTTMVDVHSDVDALLQKASREDLFPVYSEVKGLVCCGVPDMFASMWTGLTFAGVFAFALIFCTFFLIGKIDKAPRKDCCGCTCHTLGRYEGTVYPDTLPQFHTPGFDNPLGPYEAPNGAMWGDGEAAAHVVVNAPGASVAANNMKGQY